MDAFKRVDQIVNQSKTRTIAQFGFYPGEIVSRVARQAQTHKIPMTPVRRRQTTVRFLQLHIHPQPQMDITNQCHCMAARLQDLYGQRLDLPAVTRSVRRLPDRSGGYQIGEVPARRDDIDDHPETRNTNSNTRSKLE